MKTRGFTLIELLVVIAIIGILSSIALASLNAARLKAGDARIRSDLDQVSLALHFYYDKHGYYPRSSFFSEPFSSALAPLVNEGFLVSLPVSPNAYEYYYASDNSLGGAGAYSSILISQFTGTEPSTGYAGSCRPFTDNGSPCTSSQNTYYCICQD